MYRWLAVLRFLLVANTVALNVYRDGFSHPVGAALALAGMVVWTFVISWAYHSYARRTTGWASTTSRRSRSPPRSPSTSSRP